MKDKSTAFRSQKGSCPEEHCWLTTPLLLLLCLLGAGALLFPFWSPVPAAAHRLTASEMIHASACQTAIGRLKQVELMQGPPLVAVHGCATGSRFHVLCLVSSGNHVAHLQWRRLLRLLASHAAQSHRTSTRAAREVPSA